MKNLHRLNKIISFGGKASRRKSDELILKGHIKVDGKVVKLPQNRYCIEDHTFTLNGTPLVFEDKVYFLLNKPRGYLCSNKRLFKEKLAIDLLPETKERIYTVGRLDKETEGLLILTNDGEFANKVIHPRYNVQKEYLLKTDRQITHEDLVKLSKGIEIDGTSIQPFRVKKVRKNSCLITVKEGKKHEVRLLAEAARLEVLLLKRIRIGPLHLGNLKSGESRPLSLKERAAFEPTQTAL